jgi:putative aldouronate transport system substrate-binding protein
MPIFPELHFSANNYTYLHKRRERELWARMQICMHADACGYMQAYAKKYERKRRFTMKKRLIAFLLAAALTALAMAGCGAPAGQPATSAAATASTTAASEAPAPATSAETAAPAESETVAAVEPEAEPEPEQPVEISMMAPSYGEVPDMNGPWWTEYQKMTNSILDIQFVPTGEHEAKLNLALAAGDFPEVLAGVNVTAVNIGNAIRQGAFHNLSNFLGDFSAYPNLAANAEVGVFAYAKLDGAIYGIPSMRAKIDPGIKIRKDWLDELGIAIPTTLDEYKAALKAIVGADMSGTGMTLGWIQHGWSTVYSMDFLPAFGGFTPEYNDEGGMVHKNVSSAFEDMIAFFNGMYADGLLAKEWSAMSNTQAEELFTTGQAASYERNIYRDYPFQEQIKKVQPNAEVVTLPPLKGPDGYTAWLQNGYIGQGVISSKVPADKVERILRYYEQTATEEVNFHVYYGTEGVHHEVVDGQPVLTDLGLAEVTASCQQPAALFYDPWIKVVTATAPKAYNDAKKEFAAIYGELGMQDPFTGIVSSAWLDAWPRHENEWKEMATKAVNGAITLDEFHAYLEGLRNDPNLREAFKEFADAWAEFTAE